MISIIIVNQKLALNDMKIFTEFAIPKSIMDRIRKIYNVKKINILPESLTLKIINTFHEPIDFGIDIYNIPPENLKFDTLISRDKYERNSIGVEIRSNYYNNNPTHIKFKNFCLDYLHTQMYNWNCSYSNYTDIIEFYNTDTLIFRKCD